MMKSIVQHAKYTYKHNQRLYLPISFVVMVDVDTIAACRQIGSSSRLIGSKVGAILHLSNELGELSQWLCHDDSTINIIMSVIIILLFVAFSHSVLILAVCYMIVSTLLLTSPVIISSYSL